MRLADVSLIGWLHTLACVVALLFGAINIALAKGTPLHRTNGRIYVVAMIAANVLSLAIYKGDIGAHGFARGAFGVFHWLAVAALVFALVGFFAASRQARGFWSYVHPASMICGYYILVGGLINEAFVRVDALRGFATEIVHGKRVFGSPILGMTHMAAMLGAAVLVVWFSTGVWRFRRSRAQFVEQSECEPAFD